MITEAQITTLLFRRYFRIGYFYARRWNHSAQIRFSIEYFFSLFVQECIQLNNAIEHALPPFFFIHLYIQRTD